MGQLSRSIRVQFRVLGDRPRAFTWRQKHKTDPANYRITELTAHQARDTRGLIDEMQDSEIEQFPENQLQFFITSTYRIADLMNRVNKPPKQS